MALEAAAFGPLPSNYGSLESNGLKSSLPSDSLRCGGLAAGACPEGGVPALRRSRRGQASKTLCSGIKLSRWQISSSGGLVRQHGGERATDTYPTLSQSTCSVVSGQRAAQTADKFSFPKICPVSLLKKLAHFVLTLYQYINHMKRGVFAQSAMMKLNACSSIKCHALGDASDW